MTKAEKKQLRYDTAYMRMAMEWAKLSHCKRKQVGSLIVKDRMIISDGYNGTPSGFENICEDASGTQVTFTVNDDNCIDYIVEYINGYIVK